MQASLSFLRTRSIFLLPLLISYPCHATNPPPQLTQAEQDFIDVCGDNRLRSLEANFKKVKALYKQNPGINLNIQDENWLTPLHHAAWIDNEKIVLFLINKNANKEILDKDGQTPLHCAAWKENIDSLRVLIENKANLEAKDLLGNTPLHTAVFYQHRKAAKVLLQAGASKKAINNQGQTPLAIAQEKGNKRIAKLLTAQHIPKPHPPKKPPKTTKQHIDNLPKQDNLKPIMILAVLGIIVWILLPPKQNRRARHTKQRTQRSLQEEKRRRRRRQHDTEASLSESYKHFLPTVDLQAHLKEAPQSALPQRHI